MSTDAENAAAGGCCGSAADGFGIGLFETSVYGSSGSNNPGGLAGKVWERPQFLSAFAIGFDIFQNIDEISLNFNGTVVATNNLHGSWDINDGTFQSVNILLTPNGTDTLVHMAIDGYSVFANTLVSGMDLYSFPNYRLIAGGRTGGAFANIDLDNIRVGNPIPEPTTILLFGIGLLGMAGVGRRKK